MSGLSAPNASHGPSDHTLTANAERSRRLAGADRMGPGANQENERRLRKAGTPTRPSMTGRTPARWGSATSRSGGAWPMSGGVLELGCGTGRVLLPLARTGVSGRRRRSFRADARSSTAPHPSRARDPRRRWFRADIRELPFAERFSLVIAPCGILQSLTRDRDLSVRLGRSRA